MRRRLHTAKIVHVSLEEPLQRIEVEEGYRDVRLVVSSRGRVLGELDLPALGVVPVDVQRAVIAHELGEKLWREELRAGFRRAAGGAALGEAPAAVARVSVIVCTRDRPDQLRSCLESLAQLRTPPQEILVVDSAPSDERAREVCAGYPVVYVREDMPGQSRARNRGVLAATGDLVAFTDDDCVVSDDWLDGLAAAFSDPLVMAVTGYVAPLELETRAQYLFELHGGFERSHDAAVVEALEASPVLAAGPVGAGANSIFRRRVFEEVGLFAEDLGPGTPARAADDTYAFYRILAAGYRVRFDPGRVVWHRHRREYAALRRTLFDYGASVMAYATRCLLRHRELSAVRIVGWWIRHLRRDLGRVLRRDERRLPVGLVLAEAAGVLLGPVCLLRSRLSRRRIPALELGGAGGESPAEHARLSVRAGDPPLSVVIPSRNRHGELAKVLDALDGQTFPAERFEAIVVLDGSTDASAELVRSRRARYGLRLLEQENRGAAASRNRGAHEADAPVVVFLDDDVVPEPACLAAHAAAHRDAKDEHAALGYYPPVVDETSLWALTVRAWWEDHFNCKGEPGHLWTFLDFVSGNTSLPRSLFLASGGFDDDFAGRGREDWELGSRLLAAGVRLGYYPRAKAWHHLDTSFATALRQARRDAHSDYHLASKHPHLKAHLPLATVARALGEGRSPRALFAYRHPQASERLARGALPVLGVLAAAHLRGRWRRLTKTLTRHAYVLGLADVLPTPEEFLAFVAPVWRESVETVPVWLDEDERIELSPAAGSVELLLGYAARPLARVVALEPGRQWEWQAVTQRVLEEGSEAIRQAVLLERLGLAAGARWNAATEAERVVHGR